MKRLPVLKDGKRIGETVAEDERLYTRLNVRAALSGGLWCAWAVGERGEVRVGTLEPVNGQSVISRRFSKRTLAEAGEPVRVEVRPAEVTEAVRSAETFKAARSMGTPTENRVGEVQTERTKAQSRTEVQTERTKAQSRTEVQTERTKTRSRIETQTPEAGERNDGAEIPEAWRRTGTARLFRSMRFQRPLRNVREALTSRDGERRRVALIREDGAPFPIPELFCLASPARIGARDYWVFTFDRQEWPVL